MLLQGRGLFIALGIVLSGFRTIVPAEAVPDAAGYDTVLLSAIQKYENNNKAALLDVLSALNDLDDGYLLKYRFGWRENEPGRLQKARESGYHWELAEFDQKGPSYQELIDRLWVEMAKLLSKVPTPLPSDPGRDTGMMDSYRDPSQPPSGHAAGRESQSSIPLPVPTNEDKVMAFNNIVRFMGFAIDFAFIKADLAPKFFRFQGRSADIQKLSILKELANFLDSKWGRSSPFSIGRSDVYKVTRYLYSIPDDIEHTDRSASDSEDEEYWGYEPLLPTRHEFQPSGLDEFRTGLSLLNHAVSQLPGYWARAVEQMFTGGVPPNHPDVAIARDLAGQIQEFLEFYAEGLLTLLVRLEKLPRLTTRWVEPTHEQVKWWREQDLSDSMLEENEDFFKDLKVPDMNIEDGEQDGILEEASVTEYLPSPANEIEAEFDFQPLTNPNQNQMVQDIDPEIWNPADDELLQFGDFDNANLESYVTELNFGDTVPARDPNDLELPE
ncbi:hypothetical protein TWF106_008350 [Orbilia oligospora]|uniref:Uncharacterized protein n=1 Tax=Orbilia oligospora TaxID=2813651 RepID=A0A6G1MGB4_ORBOL|nr:hypothetical protein TWF191_008900 [Orbilia oligospora]KAF3227946.1 hypothetical protein TWF106_008350 [Orbilia oligospora]KAF3257606.1 hypothetical protein TWF192_000898 [Orbilia oligospora]